jgi:hypothetical protein
MKGEEFITFENTNIQMEQKYPGTDQVVQRFMFFNESGELLLRHEDGPKKSGFRANSLRKIVPPQGKPTDRELYAMSEDDARKAFDIRSKHELSQIEARKKAASAADIAAKIKDIDVNNRYYGSVNELRKGLEKLAGKPMEKPEAKTMLEQFDRPFDGKQFLLVPDKDGSLHVVVGEIQPDKKSFKPEYVVAVEPDGQAKNHKPPKPADYKPDSPYPPTILLDEKGKVKPESMGPLKTYVGVRELIAVGPSHGLGGAKGKMDVREVGMGSITQL